MNKYSLAICKRICFVRKCSHLNVSGTIYRKCYCQILCYSFYMVVIFVCFLTSNFRNVVVLFAKLHKYTNFFALTRFYLNKYIIKIKKIDDPSLIKS